MAGALDFAQTTNWQQQGDTEETSGGFIGVLIQPLVLALVC